MPNLWALQDAKNKFSEVVNKAVVEPQIITKRGQRESVLLSYTEYERLKKKAQKSNLIKFLKESPLYHLEFKKTKRYYKGGERL